VSEGRAEAIQLAVNSPANVDTATAQQRRPSETIQSEVRLNPVDTDELQLYSVIQDDEPASRRNSAALEAPVYQPGSRGYYEGLVAEPAGVEPLIIQRSLVPPLPVYDKLRQTAREAGSKAETRVKRPYLERGDFVALSPRRLHNTL